MTASSSPITFPPWPGPEADWLTVSHTCARCVTGRTAKQKADDHQDLHLCAQLARWVGANKQQVPTPIRYAAWHFACSRKGERNVNARLRTGSHTCGRIDTRVVQPRCSP